ncbi:MAG TPA: glutathione S-transferase family protein [Usitatibacteraceae bacterium]|nr:glutathione S-transferase family protein [Usitatibacteraceae bacterium]
MALDFYHGHGSPYSWRVWLALEHLGVPYELKVLSFSEKDHLKPAFVAINPRHRVPTIVDEGFVVWESLAILEYLDERFGKGKARLYPGTVQDRARIRRLIREDEEDLDGKGLTPVYEELYQKKPEGAAPDAARLAEARAKLVAELDYFGRELRGDFLAGDSPTAADFVLYPDIAYVKRIGAKKPESKLDGILPPAIAQWAARIEALPWFEKTYPPHWRS